ncbi:pyridoxamine 5'-phosphate oxidase family protein [Yinghuangia seranimata]|uniref:pyridoxamine 5'-phosphate oxidase family protein n=1 Tax=Yinghuangia seranimata TaxID=408067 RepID=UPI00248CEC33|nr:pyridoxamine 5'-phosphate oxidase family protein [Yinghuangia seranimata]MDI2127017.1 pyridoxamine 5'-phosphate oxidase family protein [Yinghuangia seranimata]
MGKVYPEGVTGRLKQFILDQPVYFTATAPLDADGHVNVSPKGHAGSFAVLDEWTVAYLDWTGSGAETHAHLRENGRITLMWTAFSGPPTVVRLHGRGEAVYPEDPRWPELAARFADADQPGIRAVVLVHVSRVSDSCGFSIPFMDYVGERPLLRSYWDGKSEEQIGAYIDKKNSASIDGLAAIDASSVVPGARGTAAAG